MNVVITGANSAVGQAILRSALQDTPGRISIVAAVRSERAADEIRPLLGDKHRVVQISYDDPARLAAVFAEASAVIHLAGILIESPGSTYEKANVAPVRNVIEAAKKSGIEKIVLVSAIGADEKSPNGYWRSKGQAEALVRESGLSYTILRVPLLLGPGTEGSAALKRNASGRRAVLIGGGRNLQQPLHVDDLALAAIVAVAPSIAKNCTLNLVGPLSLPDREIVERASRHMGRRVPIWSIPTKLASFALKIRQRKGRPGFSTEVLDVITSHTQLDPGPAPAQLGIQLTGIDKMIADSVSQG